MATYPPPNYTEPISTFNTSNWETSNTALDTNYLNAHYLKYPVAQGLETLQSTIINGDATVSGTGTFNGTLLSPSTATGFASFHKVRLTGFQEFTGTTPTATLAMSGHKIYCSNAGTTTLTLPDISVADGITYFITAKASLTINAQTGQTIFPNNTTTISLTANQTVDIGSQSGKWYIFGGNFNSAGGGGGDVYLAGTNAFTGTNTFNTNLPTSTQTPTTGTQLITKTYADATYNAGLLSSNNTWTGTNDFSNGVTMPYETIYSVAGTVGTPTANAITETLSNRWLVCNNVYNTFTLPTLSGTNKRGQRYMIQTTSTNTVITTSSSQTIYNPANWTTPLTTFTLPQNSTVIIENQELVSGTYSWVVTGGSIQIYYNNAYNNNDTITCNKANFALNGGNLTFGGGGNITISPNGSVGWVKIANGGGITYSTCQIYSTAGTSGTPTATALYEWNSGRWIVCNAVYNTFTLPTLTSSNKNMFRFMITTTASNTVISSSSSQAIYSFATGANTTTTLNLLPYQYVIIENQELVSGTYSWRISEGTYDTMGLNANNIALTGRLGASTVGTNNTAMGSLAFRTTGTSTYNTAIGNGALSPNSATNLVENVAIGAFSLGAYNSTGTNTGCGTKTFQNLSAGSGNSAFGLRCGYLLTTGNNNNTFFGADNAIGLTTNNSGDVLVGNQCMSNVIQQVMSYAQPASAVTNASSMVLAYDPINPTNPTASLYVAGMKMFCYYAGAGSFTTTVVSYTPSTKTLVVNSNVYADALSVMYFYYPSQLAYQNTITTGGTATTTVTIQTGLTISAGWTFAYLDSAVSAYKSVGISAYNSGTGVLTLASAITVGSTTGYLIWNTTIVKGDSVNDNVAIGYFSQANISGSSSRNTSMGNYALNGSGEVGSGYNNNQYLYGFDNTAVGYGAGASLLGMGNNNTFLGSGADVATRGAYVFNSTAIGYGAKVSMQNQIMLGTSAETVYFAGQLNVRSVFQPYSTGTLNASSSTITTPIKSAYNLTENTTGYTITLPLITADMVGIQFVLRRTGSIYTTCLLAPTAGNTVYLKNTTTASASALTPFSGSTDVVVNIVCLNSTQWAIL